MRNLRWIIIYLSVHRIYGLSLDLRESRRCLDEGLSLQSALVREKFPRSLLA